jgi:hypothetical protein
MPGIASGQPRTRQHRPLRLQRGVNRSGEPDRAHARFERCGLRLLPSFKWSYGLILGK